MRDFPARLPRPAGPPARLAPLAPLVRVARLARLARLARVARQGRVRGCVALWADSSTTPLTAALAGFFVSKGREPTTGGLGWRGRRVGDGEPPGYNAGGPDTHAYPSLAGKPFPRRVAASAPGPACAAVRAFPFRAPACLPACRLASAPASSVPGLTGLTRTAERFASRCGVRRARVGFGSRGGGSPCSGGVGVAGWGVRRAPVGLASRGGGFAVLRWGSRRGVGGSP